MEFPLKRFSTEWIGVVGLVLGLTARVHAQNPAPPPTDEFEQHYQAGASLYEAGSFLAATERLQAAYRIHPMPTLLINIGQAFRKAGLAQQALAYYERFFQVEPNPAPDVRAEVEGFIAQAQASLTDKVDNLLPEKMGTASHSHIGSSGYGLYVEGGGGPTPMETFHPDLGSSKPQGSGWFGSFNNTLQTGGGGYWAYRGILKIGIGVRGGKLVAASGYGDPNIIDVLIAESCLATGHATWRWSRAIGLVGPQACARPLVSYIDGQGSAGTGQTHFITGWGGGFEGQVSPVGIRFGSSSQSAILQAYVASGIRVLPKSVITTPGEVTETLTPLVGDRDLRLAGYLIFGVKLAFESFSRN